MKHMILSSGAVICRRIGEQWNFLLLQAHGFWDFPKGIVEPGEDPVAAAIRETREETGIMDLEFKWGYIYRDTGPYNNRRKIARYYIAETRTRHVILQVNPELGRPEHESFRWVTFDTAMRFGAPRIRCVIKWAADIIAA